MYSTATFASETTIAIIGAGRLGGVLARALRVAGFEVHGPVEREERMPQADLALLCVPDAAIRDAAASARPSATKLAHLSGATGLDDVDLSIHPLQTFTGDEGPEVFHGIGMATAGRTDADAAVARQLAVALGAIPFAVDDAHRAGYHAAASFASNFVLTVLDAAEQLASASGVERMHLAPLVRQSVDNWLASGAAASLTGPIARGDEATVARQRAAVAQAASGLDALFDALADATRALAVRPATVESVQAGAEPAGAARPIASVTSIDPEETPA